LDLSGNEIGALGLKHLSSLFEENNTINELVKMNHLMSIIFNFLTFFKIFPQKEFVKKLFRFGWSQIFDEYVQI